MPLVRPSDISLGLRRSAGSTWSWVWPSCWWSRTPRWRWRH